MPVRNLKLTPPLISASLLAGNLLNLESQVHAIEEAGIDMIHIDVMDGCFVPSITFGSPIISAISSICTVPLDVHLMISNIDDAYLNYMHIGASYLTFHLEASANPEALIKIIKNSNNKIKLGAALKPATCVEKIAALLPLLDSVLVMSVEPGRCGQDVLYNQIEKVRWLRDKMSAQQLIFVDGGMNDYSAERFVSAGANVIVSGSYLFNEDGDGYKVKIEKLRTSVVQCKAVS